MRGATISMLALGVLVIAGCGSSAHYADKAQPPAPVNLSVYIGNGKVLLSPSSVGAGPVEFVITNQATQAVALTVRSSGGGALASTAPINPQATASVSVYFHPGTYTVTPSSGNTSAFATPPSISPASLHVGKPRPDGNSSLLAP